MIGFNKKIVAGAVLAAASLPAAAADMPPYAAIPPVTVQEFGSGWYLRGDLGYRFNNALRGRSSDGMALFNEQFDDSFVAGAGFGYKQQWFRWDITVDYGSQARYRGDSALFLPYFTNKIDSITGLVNGYIDLGTWGGFTPYVGAGLGAAIVRTLQFETPFHASAPNGTLSNFAWAVMAGVGYNVTPGVVVDLGYRYVDVGEAKSGLPNFGPGIAYDRIGGHEVRVGARYLID